MIIKKFTDATVGAMMLGAVAIPFADASAADGKVSYADLRKKSAEVNKLVPALASGKGRVALKVLGGTPDLNKEIYRSAQKIEKAIDRDIAFLHANDDNETDGITKVEVWASGYKMHTLSLYQSDLDDKVINYQLNLVIQDGIKRVEKARKTASLDQAKKKPSATVLIEYGSKIVEIEDIAEYMESLGIKVKLQSGYANESCGRVTINGKSVEFDQDSIDGGDLGAFIQRHSSGKKVYDMPKCDVKP